MWEDEAFVQLDFDLEDGPDDSHGKPPMFLKMSCDSLMRMRQSVKSQDRRRWVL